MKTIIREDGGNTEIFHSFPQVKGWSLRAGYELAKLNSKSPLDTISVAEHDKSKELYGIYCAICHGDAGDGQGKLVTQGKFLGIPSYKDRVITEGSIYHVQTYGLNSMGSYANQLNQHERWLVAAYVLELKSKL